MVASADDALFSLELAELHDSSVALYATLPVFAALFDSSDFEPMLVDCASVLDEHLSCLDQIVERSGLPREPHDGPLTSVLSSALRAMRSHQRSTARDDELLDVLRMAHIVILGSCGFALRYTNLAGMRQSRFALERNIVRLRALAFRMPRGATRNGTTESPDLPLLACP